MKQEIWQEDQPVLQSDLNLAQSSKEDAIKERFIDSFSPGIVADSQLFSEVAPFNLTVTSLPFSVSVGTGTAYDPEGERILVANPSVVYDAVAPLTTTDNGIGGTTLTPQSTGCSVIPLVASRVNYIFISYLLTVDSTTFTLADTTNERLFVKGADGYQIVIVPDAAGVTAVDTSSTHLSTLYLAAHPNAVFLGTVNTFGVAAFGGRTFLSLKSKNLTVNVAGPLSTLNALGKPYVSGQEVAFADHVDAIGTGVVSAKNPHGLSVADLTGAFSGKTAEQHEKLFHEAGISGSQTSVVSAFYGVVQDNAGSPFIGPTYARDTFRVKKPLASGTQTFSGTGVATVFTLTGGLVFQAGYINLKVYVNGVLQAAPSEYTESGNNSIIFVVAPVAGSTITLQVDGEAVQINGITISSERILEDFDFYFVDSSGNFLSNGTYTIYIDAAAGALRLAANGSPTNTGYSVYGVTSHIRTYLNTVALTTVVANPNNFLLWEVTWNSAGTGLGNANFSAVTDKRYFGTVGSDSLRRDSLTDTVTINHNLAVAGNETIAGNVTVAGTIVSTVDNYFFLVPTGTILPYGGSTSPAGWVECDGASLSTTSYPYLFASIGYGWGGSGGSFNVPDLRGVFLRGWNHGASDSYADPDISSRTTRSGGVSTGGVGSYQMDALQTHTHSQPGGSTGGDSGLGGNFLGSNAGSAPNSPAKVSSYETRSKNASVMFIIKAS